MAKRVILLIVLSALSLSIIVTNASESYDELQTLFLTINIDSTYDEVKSMIEGSGLPFTEREYNGTKGLGKEIAFCVAFTEGAAKQKYADSGDNLNISFQKDTGRLQTMEYFSQDHFLSALVYSFGIWWSFSETDPNNDYSGYYLVNPMDTKKNGFEIQYSNGNRAKTNYYRFDDKKAALDMIETWK